MHLFKGVRRDEETVKSNLVVKRWDGSEKQYKGLGSAITFLGEVFKLYKNRYCYFLI